MIYVQHDTINTAERAFVERAAQAAGNLAMIGGLIGVTLHYLRFGRKQVKDGSPGDAE